MSWVEKSEPTTLDSLTIPGLAYLIGDLVATYSHQRWTQGMKFPIVAFPSGQECAVWESSRLEQAAIVHIFGEMDLPLNSTRDEAYKQAEKIARELGYTVHRHGAAGLEVIGLNMEDHFLLTYDDQERRIVDVAPMIEVKSEPAAPRVSLLDDETRARLPALYSGEQSGLQTLAQVKFFTPDAGWTWYASEGSPVDEGGYIDTDKEKVDFLFFGLVIGLEIELGYFGLRELEEAHGPLGLPIERDVDFVPTSLKELQDQHRRERGEG